MFEVIISKNDGTTETYDCMTEIQATFIFFRARMNASVDAVELNEIIEASSFA